MFPGRNSVVERDGEKIQIQTQLHDDWTPKVVRTEVIIKGQVKIDKRTEVDELINNGDEKKINDLIWQQHQHYYLKIKSKVDAENASNKPVEEKPIEETINEVEEEIKEEPGFFGKILHGLFGKKK